uniref:Uncharacterized protein n=3 Tax=Meloidogyne TaxID=189290 RepID=A0A6V7XU50_MELEN|nr:unnamed protein product [Meloidogyne enterolobii]
MLIGQNKEKLEINKTIYSFQSKLPEFAQLEKSAFGFFDTIEPILSLNDWTSLSVICFGVCELQLRCRYSEHIQ